MISEYFYSTSDSNIHVAWPASCSSDLNLFIYADILNVYDTPVAIVEVLRNRIIAACEKIRNTPKIFERLDNPYDDAERNHFQQFL